MANVDYDKDKFVMDEYGVLYKIESKKSIEEVEDEADASEEVER